jgi:hypothetical protein
MVVAGPVEATALGNIVMQMVATGAVESIGAGRELVARSFPAQVFEPRSSAAWDAAHARFKQYVQGAKSRRSNLEEMDKRQIGALAAVLLTVWGAVEFIRLERMWNSQFRDPYLVNVQNDRLGWCATSYRQMRWWGTSPTWSRTRFNGTLHSTRRSMNWRRGFSR